MAKREAYSKLMEEINAGKFVYTGELEPENKSGPRKQLLQKIEFFRGETCLSERLRHDIPGSLRTLIPRKLDLPLAGVAELEREIQFPAGFIQGERFHGFQNEREVVPHILSVRQEFKMFYRQSLFVHYRPSLESPEHGFIQVFFIKRKHFISDR